MGVGDVGWGVHMSGCEGCMCVCVWVCLCVYECA